MSDQKVRNSELVAIVHRKFSLSIQKVRNSGNFFDYNLNLKVALYRYLVSQLIGDMSKASTRLGEKIRELRKKQNLTLESLAEKAKLSKSYLWELENRESQRPSAEKLASLADALGVTTSYFIEEDVRAPEERHLDEAFFRSYKTLDPDAKEQLRKILDTFKK